MASVFDCRQPPILKISISIIFTVGVGVAGIMSGFIKDPSSFNSFLFGSIVAVMAVSLWLFI